MATTANSADRAYDASREIAPTKTIDPIASAVLTSSASPRQAGVGNLREQSA
jgi:hypothetical protein